MFDVGLLLNIISLQIGLENLQLNKQQIEGLDSHLKQQDDILEKDQNEMLKQILENQKIIIELLKEVRKWQQ